MPRSTIAALLFIPLFSASCGSDATSPFAPGFLGGTSSDHEVGVVLNDLSRSVTLFQHGSPATQEQVPLGSSTTITPTGMAIRGRRAVVPLGDAASVALIDLATATATRFFTFASGNATGSAWVDDSTVIAANLLTGVVGRFSIGQAAAAITNTVAVAPGPTAVAVSGGRAYVVSSNVDANFVPIGNGILSAIDPATMKVVGTVTLGGTNSSDIAVGPDGLLYVINTGDFVSPGSLTIVNPATMSIVTTIQDAGVGPGAISVDDRGTAYISGFFFGTEVFNTTTRQFTRGPNNAVCAPVAKGGCRGAFASTTDKAGNLYQAFFGSPNDNLPPYVFVYKAGSYQLTDSIAVGSGPAALAIRVF